MVLPLHQESEIEAIHFGGSIEDRA